jgi:hypothetical protein
MDNNITFGDTFWVQLQGIAMGVVAACLYSNLTFGYHENSQILNPLKKPTTHGILMSYSAPGWNPWITHGRYSR